MQAGCCRCVRCGREVKSPYPPERIHATCRVQKRGLGDYVAAVLAKGGVTKHRVSRVLGRPCKCPERQEKLNELGRKIGIG